MNTMNAFLMGDLFKKQICLKNLKSFKIFDMKKVCNL